MDLKAMTKVINGNVGAVMNRVGSAILNPNTLTGIAVVAVPTTVGFAIWGTLKASKDLEGQEEGDFFDKARKVYKYYIPTVVSGVLCVVCIVASNRLSAKEKAGLAAALAVSEEAVRQYQKQLENEGIKTKVKTHKVNTAEVQGDKTDMYEAPLDSLPREEKVWCRDKVTGTMFKTSKTDLDIVAGRIKARIDERWQGSSKAMYTINDMYQMLGVAGIEIGDDYFLKDSEEESPLIVTGEVTTNGDFYLTLDYFVENDYRDM